MATFGKNSKLKSFEKLYFDHYNMLCQTVYRFVKDEEATKDIVQEVFIKYWQRINELHISESEIAYLRKASVNAALNSLKEKERRGQRENQFAEDSDKNLSARPDVRLGIKETSKNIEQAIDHLPPACREAFILSRHEGKSYKEISDILNISINTVEKHIGKALKSLKGLLGRT